MKRALLTGVTRQDGSYLAEFLLAKGYEIYGIIRRSSSFNTVWAIGFPVFVFMLIGTASADPFTAPHAYRIGPNDVIRIQVFGEEDLAVESKVAGDGTIAFRSSDPTGRLPRNYMFTAAEQGVHTFTGLVLKKRGNQTVTVTDTLVSALTASVTISVW